MQYATIADLEAAVQGTPYEAQLPPTDAGKTKLIEDAERDVDQALGPGPRTATGGLLFNPAADLEDQQRTALAAAVCEQAMYRIEMGPEHFVRAQREAVSSRHFSARGKLPIVGPAAMRMLTYTDLLRNTTQTSSRSEDDLSPADIGWE